MHKVDTAGSVAGAWVDKVPSVSPGTLMGEDWHNAVQQEVIQVIQAMNITIEASGTADAAAGFIQLREALFEKFLGADPRRFGAVGDGVADDRAAFVSALAASNVLLIPEGTFLISSTITLPEGAVVIGKGLNSILKVTADDNIFGVGATSAMIASITINGNGTGVNQKLVRWVPTGVGDKQLFLTYIIANNLGGQALDVETNTVGNNLIMSRCIVQNSGAGLRIGSDSAHKGAKSHISDCIFRNNTNPVTAEGGESRVVFDNCELFDGILKLANISNVHFQGCSIDIDSWDPDNLRGVMVTNCNFPNTLSNTFPTDAGAKNSYIQFLDNLVRVGADDWKQGWSSGSIWHENLKGGFAELVLNADELIVGLAAERTVSSDDSFTVSEGQQVGPVTDPTFVDLINTANGRVFNKLTPGIVQIQVFAVIDFTGGSGTQADVRLQLLKNGTDIILGMQADPFNVYTGSAVVHLDVDDFLTVVIRNLGTGAVDDFTLKASPAGGAIIRAYGL